MRPLGSSANTPASEIRAELARSSRARLAGGSSAVRKPPVSSETNITYRCTCFSRASAARFAAASRANFRSRREREYTAAFSSISRSRRRPSGIPKKLDFCAGTQSACLCPNDPAFPAGHASST
eukprot:scaffold99292_cov32-Tisochrysis_lutea.AAC.3